MSKFESQIMLAKIAASKSVTADQTYIDPIIRNLNNERNQARKMFQRTRNPALKRQHSNTGQKQNPNYIQLALNKHLKTLEDWFRKWKIELNRSKTEAIMFSSRNFTVTARFKSAFSAQGKTKVYGTSLVKLVPNHGKLAKVAIETIGLPTTFGFNLKNKRQSNIPSARHPVPHRPGIPVRPFQLYWKIFWKNLESVHTCRSDDDDHITPVAINLNFLPNPEINDFVRYVDLPKEWAQVLGSRLKGKKNCYLLVHNFLDFSAEKSLFRFPIKQMILFTPILQVSSELSHLHANLMNRPFVDS
ncbi:hypothetical protein AVEN_258971-1 [Araneus ventricosus]|uniref:Uncharacterized protein n=1 Tax=Araneus ventricosus TaxID=182803 RepID=A0A4Y2CE29_ARAVE|nr:hypothetical protein AVEN_258971-1 [Araneus ventricosus]